MLQRWAAQSLPLHFRRCLSCVSPASSKARHQHSFTLPLSWNLTLTGTLPVGRTRRSFGGAGGGSASSPKNDATLGAKVLGFNFLRGGVSGVGDAVLSLSKSIKLDPGFGGVSSRSSLNDSMFVCCGRLSQSTATQAKSGDISEEMNLRSVFGRCFLRAYSLWSHG